MVSIYCTFCPLVAGYYKHNLPSCITLCERAELATITANNLSVGSIAFSM